MAMASMHLQRYRSITRQNSKIELSDLFDEIGLFVHVLSFSLRGIDEVVQELLRIGFGREPMHLKMVAVVVDSL